MSKSKPPICVDFDGVLNNYTGWNGPDELYAPRPGAKEFLETLSEYYIIIIFTTRNRDKVMDWLYEYDLDYFVYDVTDIKVPAVAYIDDRALQFNGDYQETLDSLDGFRTHWEK